MTTTVLFSTFDAPQLLSQLQWHCPPQTWRSGDSALVIHTDAETDFWQRTHYGFQADNGHLLYAIMEDDFVLTTTVHFEMVNQYDQAGLMVRLSPDCWLKTAVEYELDEPNRLGAVVTNNCYSDWSTQDIADDVTALSLRVRRESGDYTVEYTLDVAPSASTRWTQIRLARLLEDDGRAPVWCGLYACSPKGAGFAARFDYLRLEGGRSG